MSGCESGLLLVRELLCDESLFGRAAVVYPPWVVRLAHRLSSMAIDGRPGRLPLLDAAWRSLLQTFRKTSCRLAFAGNATPFLFEYDENLKNSFQRTFRPDFSVLHLLILDRPINQSVRSGPTFVSRRDGRRPSTKETDRKKGGARKDPLPAATVFNCSGNGGWRCSCGLQPVAC